MARSAPRKAPAPPPASSARAAPRAAATAKSPRRNGRKTVGCPVETTLAAIGGRWKVLVLHYLFQGTQRFGDLTRHLGGISARTLTRQLRELEESGLIHRHVHAQIPPKVEYSLTPLGRDLEPVLQAMHAWGERVEHANRSGSA